MPRYAYTSVLSTATPSGSPKEWPIAWPYPLPDDGPWVDPDAPWPPGWPIPPIDPDNLADTYTVTLTVPAALDLTAQSLTANLFTQVPAPAAFLDNHIIGISCTVDGNDVQVKKLAGDPWVRRVFFEVSQHDGVNYGIAESVFFNFDATLHGGKVATVKATVVTVVPNIEGTDTGTVVVCPITSVVVSGNVTCPLANGTYTTFTYQTAPLAGHQSTAHNGYIVIMWLSGGRWYTTIWIGGAQVGTGSGLGPLDVDGCPPAATYAIACINACVGPDAQAILTR